MTRIQETTGHGTVRPIRSTYGARVGTHVVGDNDQPVTDFTDAEWDYLHTLPEGTFINFTHTITAD